MTDETVTKVLDWTEQKFRPLLRRYLDGSSEYQLDKPFLRVFWSFDCLYASEFDIDTRFADQTLLLPAGLDLDFRPEDMQDDSFQRDHVASCTDYMLTRFARLVRMNAW